MQQNQTIKIDINMSDSEIRNLNSIIQDLVSASNDLSEAFKDIYSALESLDSGTSSSVSTFNSQLDIITNLRNAAFLMGNDFNDLTKSLELLITKKLNAASAAGGLSTAFLSKGVAAKVAAGSVRILNVALKALPFIGAGLAVWSLVSSLASLAFGSKETAEEVQTLTERIDENRQSHEERGQEIMKDVRTNNDLVARLRELQAQESLTNAERVESVRISQELNDRLEGMNLTFDKSTGFLDENGSAALEIADHYADLASATTTLESNQQRLNEIMEEFGENDLELKDLQEELENTSEFVYDFATGTEILNSEFINLTSEIKRLEDQQGDLRLETAELEAQTYETATHMAELWDMVAYQNSLSFDTMTEAQKAVVEGFQSMYEISAQRLGDLTTEFKENTDLTWEAVQKNQKDIIKATEEHTDTYAELVASGVSEAYLQAIGADSVESLPLLREMMDDGIDTVKSRESEWLDAHEANADTLMQAYDFSPEHESVIRNYMLGGVRDTFVDTIDSADFPSIGASVVEVTAEGLLREGPTLEKAAIQSGNYVLKGFGDTFQQGEKELFKSGTNLGKGFNAGVEEMIPTAGETSKDLAMEVYNQLRDFNDENSPSRLYMRSGENIVKGLVKGLEALKSKPTKTIETLATKMQSVYNSANRDYTTIGRDIMNGLNQGLLNGEGIVMATANRMANNIATTMRKALDINSPSRVMREQIGRQIPAGVAAGIDKYADNAIDSMHDLGDSLTKINFPNINDIINTAPSLSLSAATSGGGTNNDYSVVNNNQGLFEGANINWSGEQDIRRTMEKIAWVTKQEQARLWR